MIGTKYERLTVVNQVSKGKWLCKCDCGNEKICYTCQLVGGNNKSCDCLKKEMTTERNTTHGLSKRPEYSNWKDMNKRCFNPKNKRYADYAGRGISVHEDFIKDFPAWLQEIGPKPTDGQRWSVGRIDNDGWYTYGNIEWQLDDEQSRNHSMQSNNTSGVVGVKHHVATHSGKDYHSFVAGWNDETGKRRNKSFSVTKYGYDAARDMAIAYRAERLLELEQFGIIYAKSHGTAK